MCAERHLRVRVHQTHISRSKMHRQRRAAQNEQAARAAGAVAEHLSQLKPEDLPPVHVVVYKGATKFVKHYPVTSFLYILGIGLMCFATGNPLAPHAPRAHPMRAEDCDSAAGSPLCARLLLSGPRRRARSHAWLSRRNRPKP